MENDTKQVKILFRTKEDKIIAGVCGGLGEYLNIDPGFIRVLFIIFAFFGGASIVIYIIMWLFVPEEQSVKKTHQEAIEENIAEIKSVAQTVKKSVSSESVYNGKLWVAVVLILTGIVFLLNNFGLYYIDIGKLWPIWIILLGLLLLLKE